MHNLSLARKAGIIGMVGGVLWIMDIVMQHSVWPELTSGPLYTILELLAFTALLAVNIGFLGLIWGGAFRGRFGTFAVGVHVFAYSLIVLGGIAALTLGDAAGPLFLLFPIGGALEGVGKMLLIVAVLATGRWDGWQRWIPLFYGIYETLAVGLPMVLGVTPDGPGMSVQIGTGIWWLLVGLAVYTVSARSAVRQVAVVRQA